MSGNSQSSYPFSIAQLYENSDINFNAVDETTTTAGDEEYIQVFEETPNVTPIVRNNNRPQAAARPAGASLLPPVVTPPPRGEPQEAPWLRRIRRPVSDHEGTKDCGVHLVQDKAMVATQKHWNEKRGRMNLVTHKASVPCDMLRLTHNRVQYESVENGLRQMHTRLGEIIEAMDASEPKPTLGSPPATPQVPPNGINVSPAANCLRGHNTLTRLSGMIGTGMQWAQLRDESDDRIMLGDLSEQAKLLDQFRTTRSDMAAVFKKASSLREHERLFTQIMYPETMADIYKIFKCYGVYDVDRPPLEVPCLASDFCAICLENADEDKLFARIQSRCTQHDVCTAERCNGAACKCSNDKVFHLACLAADMLAQYNGRANEGVGCTRPTCALCRGTYCYNDLMTVTVVGPASVAQAPAKSAAKRVADESQPELGDEPAAKVVQPQKKRVVEAK